MSTGGKVEGIASHFFVDRVHRFHQFFASLLYGGVGKQISLQKMGGDKMGGHDSRFFIVGTFLVKTSGEEGAPLNKPVGIIGSQW